MSGKTVSSAVILLILGNLAATFCDAFIKAAGNDIPIFQFIFIRALCTALLLLPFYRSIDWSQLLVGAKLHFIRGNLWVFSSLLLIIALQLLPLSTANAIFYSAPIMIVLLSTIFFKERLTFMIGVAVLGGFFGILIILRPSEISWGALCAIGFSLTLALSNLLVRRMPEGQSLIHGLWMTQLFALPFSFALCVWEGAEWHLEMVEYTVGSAICSIIYSCACMMAYRYIDANRIASAEYTGLIFAVLVGWLVFNEVPDFWLAIGSAFIIIPIILLGRADRKNSKLAPANS